LHRTIELPQEAKSQIHSQDIINFIDNIMVRIYHTPKGFCFRYVTNQDFSEYDPIHKESPFTWAYGPFNSPDEAMDVAKDKYLKLQ